ncbi:unnamed protein product [Euphydryas editha]|uniref:Uncharacterized protein n=1 Tax=Euphydryas editha TaxID=104508 RepID=A0AAU9UL95_EUPED|nr:unnamed protein product [Euphydryas editha]
MNLKIPYVRIGDSIILLNNHNKNEIKKKSVITNSIEDYDKKLELIKMILNLFMKNRNTKHKLINTSLLNSDKDIYVRDKNIKNFEVALRKEFDSEDISNDDKGNDVKSSEEIHEQKTVGEANLRHTYCKSKRRTCVRACREAYEDACYNVYCARKLKRKLRRSCKRECIAWFY